MQVNPNVRQCKAGVPKCVPDFLVYIITHVWGVCYQENVGNAFGCVGLQRSTTIVGLIHVQVA